MIIEVIKKTVYGNDLYYPHNPLAHQFASLIGNKTFSVSQLKQIKAMNIDVQFARDEVQL